MTNKKTVHNVEPVKKLYRSKEDKIIAGVCGGIAEYFSIDPIWVRLTAIILLFLNGIGALLYIILWILVPENPKQKNNKKTMSELKINEIRESIKKNPNRENKKRRSGHTVIGGILIIVGILFLIKNVFGWFNTEIFWGALIIGIGAMLLLKK